LRPVLGLVEVQGGDGGLEHVEAAAAERERAIEHRSSGGDLFEVPEGAVLVAEEHELDVGEAGLSASVVDEHQGQQSVHLGFVTPLVTWPHGRR
jgi:hypothetical protein